MLLLETIVIEFNHKIKNFDSRCYRSYRHQDLMTFPYYYFNNFHILRTTIIIVTVTTAIVNNLRSSAFEINFVMFIAIIIIIAINSLIINTIIITNTIVIAEIIIIITKNYTVIEFDPIL